MLPTVSPEGGNACLELFICTITHAKISSQIATAIATMKNSNPKLDTVISTMADLDRKLKSWRSQLPRYINLDQPLETGHLPPSVLSQHFSYLLYSYCGSLIAIYSILVQPWNAITIQVDQSQREELGREVQKASDIIVDASRKMIEHLPHIKIDSSTPKWYSYSLPRDSNN
jgi:hypothetical protein